MKSLQESLKNTVYWNTYYDNDVESVVIVVSDRNSGLSDDPNFYCMVGEEIEQKTGWILNGIIDSVFKIEINGQEAVKSDVKLIIDTMKNNFPNWKKSNIR